MNGGKRTNVTEREREIEPVPGELGNGNRGKVGIRRSKTAGLKDGDVERNGSRKVNFGERSFQVV